MRTGRFSLFALALAALTAPAAGGDATHPSVAPQAWQRAPDVIGGWASTHVIVRLAEGARFESQGGDRFAVLNAGGDVADAELADLLAAWRVSAIEATLPFEPAHPSLAERFGLTRYHTLHVPAGTDTPALARELAASPAIESAEVDGIGGLLATFPNDSGFGNQYGLHNTGQTIGGQTGIPDADIDAPEAWDLETGDSGVVLALIDTGVSYSHPDLDDKLLLPGYNAQDGSDNADDSWLISHGTHCAGIAAAESNNSQGVAGVCWAARILPVRVLNDFGSGTETECANGVIWAADQGADVGSMSLGYPDGISYFENAINYAHAAGMVLCAATGNTPGAQIFFPARWDNTIAVGATDNRDQLASFTTTGPQMSVVAAGVSVYSCIDDLFNGGLDSYTYFDGTSMACPHVAGLACLIRSVDPTLSSDEVRQIIEQTADDKGTPGWDQQYGHGRINALAAVTLASDPPDPTIEHQVVEVAISAAAKADDPALASAQSFDLQVVMSDGDDWTSSDATASVDGALYQHGDLDADVPQANLWSTFPSVEFDSFFSAPGFAVPGFADGPIVTGDSMSAIWFDTPNTGSGTYTIARFTVTAGTTLTISGQSTAAYSDGVLHPFDFEVALDIPQDCPGDLNGDGFRDQADLGALLAAYGQDDGGDIDGDGDTDQADLGALLGVFNVPCP
jgi:subtilisin family serine protease